MKIKRTKEEKQLSISEAEARIQSRVGYSKLAQRVVALAGITFGLWYTGSDPAATPPSAEVVPPANQSSDWEQNGHDRMLQLYWAIGGVAAVERLLMWQSLKRTIRRASVSGEEGVELHTLSVKPDGDLETVSRYDKDAFPNAGTSMLNIVKPSLYGYSAIFFGSAITEKIYPLGLASGGAFVAGSLAMLLTHYDEEHILPSFEHAAYRRLDNLEDGMAFDVPDENL